MTNNISYVHKKSNKPGAKLFFSVAIGLLVLTLSTTTTMSQQVVNAQGYSRSPAELEKVGETNSGSTVPAASNARPDGGGTPSAINAGGDFSAQAALTGPFVLQSHNVQNLQAVYEVGFRASSPGTIATVEITFPLVPGTPIGGARLLEVEGLGDGFLQVSGNKLIYNVNSPTLITAGTDIRIEIANIFNPLDPASFAPITVTIETKNSGGGTIDGPTAAPAYTIRKIGTGQIGAGAVTTTNLADNAVTTSKLAPGSVAPFVIQRGSATVSVPPNSFGTANAFCQAGEQVVGGGYFINAGGANILKLASEGKSGNGWAAEMFNHDSVARSFTARAECMPAVP